MTWLYLVDQEWLWSRRSYFLGLEDTIEGKQETDTADETCSHHSAFLVDL